MMPPDAVALEQQHSVQNLPDPDPALVLKRTVYSAAKVPRCNPLVKCRFTPALPIDWSPTHAVKQAHALV